MKVVILLLMLFCLEISVTANDSNLSTISAESIIEHYKQLNDILLDHNLSKISPQKNGKSDIKKYFEQNAIIAEKIGNEKVAKEMNKIVKNFSEYSEKVPTFFYLYSESMPPIALERFYLKFKELKIKSNDNSLLGYAVFRGYPKNFSSFAQKYKRDSISAGKFLIHPFIYKFYDLESVPAFAFAYCPKDFSFNQCEGHLLVRGDLAFDEALKIFANEDKRIKRLYEQMVK